MRLHGHKLSAYLQDKYEVLMSKLRLFLENAKANGSATAAPTAKATEA